MEYIEKKIKALLSEKNITIRALSNMINMSEANIYKCFKRNSMELKHIESIAKALDVPISYFFNDEIENNSSVKNNGDKNKNITFQNNNLGDNNNVSVLLHDKEEEIERLKREIEHLNSLLEAKDKIISLLERK